jgi:hypothetical protein
MKVAPISVRRILVLRKPPSNPPMRSTCPRRFRRDMYRQRVNLVNMRYTEISLTSASQVIFILAQTDIPQNVMIIGRLVGNLIIPPQQNVTALFKLLEPDPQIIKAIDQQIDPSSYPLTAAGLLTLVIDPSGNSFVSLTITIDPLLLTAKK